MINSQTTVRAISISVGIIAVFIAIFTFSQANITFYNINESLMNRIGNPLAINAPIDVHASSQQIQSAVWQVYASQTFILCAIALVCSGIAYRFENTISDLLRRSHRLFY